MPVFSFNKLGGLDAYLSPEMKSTGEAIGYDEELPRALYKAMQAAGMKLQDHGTVLVSVCTEDLEEALPLIRRFYRMGFNIEATTGTAEFLKAHGIRTRRKRITRGPLGYYRRHAQRKGGLSDQHPGPQLQHPCQCRPGDAPAGH